MRRTTRKVVILSALLTTVFFGVPVFASNTDGTINSSAKYAWGDKIGWISFGAVQGNVRITDSQITGYAWSDRYGWINLNPTGSGIRNNSEGTLSGSAWSTAFGWVDFSGVTIDSNGVFNGQASGATAGIITFDCASCNAQTDWRPRGVRPACNNTLDDDGDGRVDSADSGCESLSDDDEVDGALFVSRTAPSAPSAVMVAPTSVVFFPPTATAPVIDRPAETPPRHPSMVSRVREAVRPLLEELKPYRLPSIKIPALPLARIFSQKFLPSLKLLLPRFFGVPLAPRQIPAERLIAKRAPYSMKGGWDLLSVNTINKFVFAPLPRELIALEKKFPNFREILKSTGVARMSDLSKLLAVKFRLPGLTQLPAIASMRAAEGVLLPPKGLPLARLSHDMKSKIPSEIVFARYAGELIDLNIAVMLSQKGKVEQRIKSISGKPLHLVVRAERPVKRIKGYVVFRARKTLAQTKPMPLASLLSSFVFAAPAFAHPSEQPIVTEERLVLAEFEYTDPDGDGIYTADIQTPVPVGEYEIITVMDYEDPELGSKEIRLITVVDPEGYIYEKIRNQELRISGAVVTLYWLNQETKAYEEWPAKDYQQENSQITDARGAYSFLVPEGTYYLRVAAPGYRAYEGKPFDVDEGSGVHYNIEMKTGQWWAKALDWRTALLIAVSLFLVYNFYRDRRREK